MKPYKAACWRRISIGLVLCLGAMGVGAAENADLSAFEKSIRGLVTQGKLVGVQGIVGQRDKTLLKFNAGVRSVNDPTPVNDQTMFCIGSCSKPFTSACIMTLVQEGKLKLDAPIDGRLPVFAHPAIVEAGAASRAPTLRELLAHRGGIYSQKRGMSRRQGSYIRDFTLTLDESVERIGAEKLIAEPGSEFAYSGAGYCVVGKLGEVGGGASFESLMQERIAKPLGLKRTSYFPDHADPNLASGSTDGKPNPTTPHLYKPFNLPLIGGSLYSTATDCGRFAQMIINHGALGTRRVLTQAAWDDLTRTQFEGQPYGLGWSLHKRNGKVAQMSHTGSLASSRAAIRLDLESGRYAIVLYTISDQSAGGSAGPVIGRAITAVLGRPSE